MFSDGIPMPSQESSRMTGSRLASFNLTPAVCVRAYQYKSAAVSTTVRCSCIGVRWVALVGREMCVFPAHHQRERPPELAI